MDLLESMLQSEEDEEITESSNKGAGSCSGRRCSANEHCCHGTVCVDLDGRKLQKKKEKKKEKEKEKKRIKNARRCCGRV